MHGRPPKHPLPRSLNGLVLSQANVRRTKAGVSVEELVETWGAAGHAGRGVRLGALSPLPDPKAPRVLRACGVR
jgi:hypothetical protein